MNNKSSSFLFVLLIIVIFVTVLLFRENDNYWYILLFILLLAQMRFKNNAAMLLPIIAFLTLTEFYFTFYDKRFYFAELLYFPLLINYLILNKGKTISEETKTSIKIFLLITLAILINVFIYNNYFSSLYRFRSFALPIFLIGITANLVKNKIKLQNIINVIIIITLIGSIVIFLQYFTGSFYILQKHIDTIGDKTFINNYIQWTADSIFFTFFGLTIKGIIPPVGLNYFKFGYSEIVIIPYALSFSFLLFSTKTKTRMLYATLAVIFFIATFLTGSRSVILTLLIASLILIAIKKKSLKWKHILGIIIGFFSIIYLIMPTLKIITSEEFGTLLTRIFYIDDFYMYIGSNPWVLLIGSNPDLFMKFAKTEQPPHHFFAFGTIYEGAIITGIIFWLLIRFLKKTYIISSKDKELLSIHYGLWVGVFVFVFIYGQTSYLTWSTPHNMYYYFVIGLIISSYKLMNS